MDSISQPSSRASGNAQREPQWRELMDELPEKEIVNSIKTMVSLAITEKLYLRRQ